MTYPIIGFIISLCVLNEWEGVNGKVCTFSRRHKVDNRLSKTRLARNLHFSSIKNHKGRVRHKWGKRLPFVMCKEG